jgi:threonine dehydrogenase-like Zn-dependent dehydrogenase
MKALRFENDALVVRDVSVPSRADEALVRVTLAGICNTDLEIARGYAGFTGTLGHEFVGVVENAPDEHLIGARVVGEINAGCGRCELCASRDMRHCPERTVLGIVGRDGAMAEYLQLPVENLLHVPDSVSDERAVFTEPLAAACGIAERVSITKETSVAIIGDGKLGLLCAQALAQISARVTLIGKHANKLRIAAESPAGDIETVLLDDFGRSPRQFDVVVEASGAESGFGLALDITRPRGTLVLKSTFHGTTRIQSSRIVVDEISVVGSRCGRFAPALELLERNLVNVESLIDDTLPLMEGVRAMERAAERGALKILLKP